MVNKENMRLWVAALRSGEYAQGFQRLKQIPVEGGRPGYCCLGVACEVAMRHGVSLEVTMHPRPNGPLSFAFNGTQANLPYPVMQWLGLAACNPLVGGSSDARPNGADACYVNDGLSWDFPRIADSIEKFYELKEEKNAEQG